MKGNQMKKIIVAVALLMSTSAYAGYPYGTYQNPIWDRPLDGDWSAPVHRGMYCVQGLWHYGWLRPWEGKMVIKPSCGEAINQIPM